jgi:flagellar biosynthesis repressor protein FlbT
MKSALQIGLRAGERIYINGAVLRVDRKVRLELLNDATFLIGSHVMQLEEATTPMRQLYFLVQSLMMDPGVTASLRPTIEAMIAAAIKVADDAARVSTLIEIGRLVDEGSTFEALKAVRALVAEGNRAAATSAAVQPAREVA